MSSALWTAFETENRERLAALRRQLQLWKLEAVSTRVAWQLWPSDATRRAYALALSEREKTEAAVLVLEGAR